MFFHLCGYLSIVLKLLKVFVFIICRMFYFFFESRNRKEDPVVIWLTGGPGCSSELALFYENGPFKIANNLSLVWNEYGWDQVLSLVTQSFWFRFELHKDM